MCDFIYPGKWSKNIDAVKFQGKLFKSKSTVGINHLYASMQNSI